MAVVRRGRRDGFVEGNFGREAISAHDIGFRGVASEVACEIGEAGAGGTVTGVGDVASEDFGDKVGVAGGEGGETGVANVTVARRGEGFGFFACFVRTCS